MFSSPTSAMLRVRCRTHLNVDLTGDGPDAGPEVVKTGVFDAQPVGQVAGVGESRAQAYKLGISKLSALQAASPRQLVNEIRVYTPDIIEDTVRLENNAYITVEERMNVSGQLGYVGLVNIELRYTEDDD